MERVGSHIMYNVVVLTKIPTSISPVHVIIGNFHAETCVISLHDSNFAELSIYAYIPSQFSAAIVYNHFLQVAIYTHFCY